MSIKSSKNIEARAAKLLEERKILRSKCTAARQAVRAKSNIEIVKTVRTFFAVDENDPAVLCSKLAEIFACEKDSLAQVSLTKTPRKK